jgi:CHAT domain-containing protein/tetratricopeptide (TPR) repeat protein
VRPAIFVALLLLATFRSLPTVAQEAEDRAAALEARIDSLRVEARYTEAAQVARELLEVRRADATSQPYQVGDANRLCATMEMAVALPEQTRRELAETDRLEKEIEDAFASGDYASALEKAKHQLVERRRLLGEAHPDVATSLHNVAAALTYRGEYSQAEPLFRESLALYRKLLGREHPYIATSLAQLAGLLEARGDYAGAELLARDSFAMRRKLLGEEHMDVASSLGQLAALLRARGNYAQAEALYRESLAMYRKLIGEEDRDVARSLNNLALCVMARGDYAQAEALYREALAMYRKLIGEEHPSVATTINNLAVLLKARGKYAEAEQLLRESLAVFRKLLGENHPRVATVLDDLGTLFLASGDYAEAEVLFHKSLAMRRQLFGEEHWSVAESLNNLGTLFQHRGDYTGAETLFRKSLALRRKLLGEEHPSVAISLNNLALLLQNRGDYSGAEPLYREALAMHRRLLGEKHAEVATSLHNLAVLLLLRRDYATAEPLLRESLAMRRGLLGEEHPEVANSLGHLGILLQARGDYSGAELLFRESLAMFHKLLGKEHRSVCWSLKNLAELLQVRRDYDGAEPLFRESLALATKLLGEEHPAVAADLEHLAVLAIKSGGDYAGAELLFRESLAMRRKLQGEEHPDVANTLEWIATLLVLRGDYVGAESFLTDAARVYETARLRAGSGLERATFQRSPYSALAAVRLTLGRREDAWSSVERDVGRALADLLMAAEGRGLTAEETTRSDSLSVALADAEGHLEAFLKQAGADNTEAAQRVEEARNRLLEAEAAWCSFQRMMAEEHPVTEGQAYPLKRVQKVLDERAAIVGWLDAGWREVERGSWRYDSWVYAIRKTGPVRWARLEGRSSPDVSPFKQLWSFRWELANWTSPVSALSRDSQRLFSCRIQPLLAALDGIEELLIIPSGAMVRVPLEALMVNQGTYLSDRFTISYIPSATIYTWLHEQTDNEGEAETDGAILLVGDPPFNETHLMAIEEEEAEQLELAMAETCDVSTMRSALVGNEEALATLSRLPGARAEVKALASLAPSSTLLLGPDASEQEIVRLAESGELSDFSTLHFATHALVDDDRPENSCLMLSRVDLPDPLEAAMTGARNYDGRLTAKEILREWDLDADLVTLSACETGLGKEVAGEGTVGFVHTLLQAGARSLLVSLWKVEDQATSLLMRRFYGNWMEREMSKAEALREAKVWLRSLTTAGVERELRALGLAPRTSRGVGGVAEVEEIPGDERPYAHPYYWAPFILFGDHE